MTTPETTPVEVTQADDAVAKLIDPDAWHETLPTDGCGAYWMGRRNKARAQAHAIHALISDRASNKAGGLWYRRWFTVQTRVNELEALIDNPPAHRFWGAGEPDCPSDIKAGNGELHTLRCKACGQDNPRNDRCHRLTPRQDGLREAATFLLWAYDQKQPVADAHEAWKALRAALSPDDGEGK